MLWLRLPREWSQIEREETQDRVLGSLSHGDEGHLPSTPEKGGAKREEGHR